MEREVLINNMVLEACKTAKGWLVRESRMNNFVLQCKNKNCSWKIGIRRYINGNWKKISSWNTTHIPGCPYKGTFRGIPAYFRRKGIQKALKTGEPTSKASYLMCKSLLETSQDISNRDRQKIWNSVYYIRKSHGITESQRAQNLSRFLSELKFSNYTIFDEGNDKYVILVPYLNNILDHFYSPVFVDGTFCSDQRTIIHASAVATNNKTILIGLILFKFLIKIPMKFLINLIVNYII